MKQHFDDHTIAEASAVQSVSAEQMATVRALVAADLGRGRDAWPAVNWLAATNDLMAKKHLLAELNGMLAGTSSDLLTHEAAVNNFSSDVVFGRAARDRRRMGRAFDFAAALLRSMPGATETVTDAEFEEQVDRRRRQATDREARTEALQRLGVQAGHGLPFYELYMKRRSKKNWEKRGGDQLSG